jgi:hypothetical protein
VEAMRQKFLRRVGPVLQEVGYHLPITYETTADHWEITSELPWARWNPKTRRLEKG